MSAKTLTSSDETPATKTYEQSAQDVRWAIRYVAFSGREVTVRAVQEVPKCAGLSDEFVRDQIAVYWA